MAGVPARRSGGRELAGSGSLPFGTARATRFVHGFDDSGFQQGAGSGEGNLVRALVFEDVIHPFRRRELRFHLSQNASSR